MIIWIIGTMFMWGVLANSEPKDKVRLWIGILAPLFWPFMLGLVVEGFIKDINGKGK